MKTFLTILFFLFAFATNAQEIKKIKITDLEKTINESKQPLVINFWATYCVPCLKEMPYFQEKVKEYKSQNVSLLLVSLDLQDDYPKKIDGIRKKLKLTYPVQYLDETNADYFCPRVDTSWSGALPATLFINNTTGYRKFIEDEISKEDFEKHLDEMLVPKKEK
jgi:thiol-disulfide isomerase/thioredoxin